VQSIHAAAIAQNCTRVRCFCDTNIYVGKRLARAIAMFAINARAYTNAVLVYVVIYLYTVHDYKKMKEKQ
jgi:hypothetical protein